MQVGKAVLVPTAAMARRGADAKTRGEPEAPVDQVALAGAAVMEAAVLADHPLASAAMLARCRSWAQTPSCWVRQAQAEIARVAAGHLELQQRSGSSIAVLSTRATNPLPPAPDQRALGCVAAQVQAILNAVLV